MKHIPAFLILSIAFFMSLSANSSTLVGCFDCSSSQSKSAAIKVQKGLSSQENKIEVIDFKNNIVKSYIVERDPESNSTFLLNTYSSSSAKKAASDLTTEYNRIKNQLNSMNHISNVFNSAYGVTTNMNNYGLVTNEFVNQTSFIEKVGMYGSIVAGTLAKVIINANFTVDIGFTDGSYIRFKISGVNANGDVEFEVLDVVDSDGNKIPKEKAEIAGRYVFTSESGNFDRFKDLVVDFGVDVSGWEWGMGGGGGGTVYIEDCVGACKLKPN